MRHVNLDASALAREFDVSEELMLRFIDRFAPDRVPAGRYAADADTMLFVHIPKTAGVSVGRSLRGAFDRFWGVEWNDVAKSFRHATREAVYLQTYTKTRQVIMGHYGWNELQIWRNHEMPMKCGTIFRDPVARAVSNYNYNCSSAHPDNANFKSRFPTLQSYLSKTTLDVQLTQAVGMINAFETAMTKLLTHYSFLGVTEHLAASLQHLSRSHGLSNLREHRENVGQIKVTEDVPDELRKVVEHRSRNDLKIHRLVSRLYASSAR